MRRGISGDLTDQPRRSVRTVFTYDSYGSSLYVFSVLNVRVPFNMTESIGPCSYYPVHPLLAVQIPRSVFVLHAQQGCGREVTYYSSLMYILETSEKGSENYPTC